MTDDNIFSPITPNTKMAGRKQRNMYIQYFCEFADVSLN